MKNKIQKNNNTKKCADAKASSACIVMCKYCGNPPSCSANLSGDKRFYLECANDCNVHPITKLCRTRKQAAKEWNILNT